MTCCIDECGERAEWRAPHDEVILPLCDVHAESAREFNMKVVPLVAWYAAPITG